VDDPEAYIELESVYLDLHGERIPFFIDGLDLKHNRRAVVKFHDFDSIEDAESLAGLEMYLPSTQLPPLGGNQFYFHEIIGYTVVDESYGNIGILEDILELPHQSIFQVRHGEKEILVPVVDEVILRLDRETRQLFIRAPEGLIDIYL
jgi:16S rRNA processing protein RimM